MVGASVDHEHGRLYGPGPGSVQGLLAMNATVITLARYYALRDVKARMPRRLLREGRGAQADGGGLPPEEPFPH
jgi:hypothetical protein